MKTHVYAYVDLLQIVCKYKNMIKNKICEFVLYYNTIFFGIQAMQAIHRFFFIKFNL